MAPKKDLNKSVVPKRTKRKFPPGTASKGKAAAVKSNTELTSEVKDNRPKTRRSSRLYLKVSKAAQTGSTDAAVGSDVEVASEVEDEIQRNRRSTRLHPSVSIANKPATAKSDTSMAIHSEEENESKSSTRKAVNRKKDVATKPAGKQSSNSEATTSESTEKSTDNSASTSKLTPVTSVSTSTTTAKDGPITPAGKVLSSTINSPAITPLSIVPPSTAENTLITPASREFPNIPRDTSTTSTSKVPLKKTTHSAASHVKRRKPNAGDKARKLKQQGAAPKIRVTPAKRKGLEETIDRVGEPNHPGSFIQCYENEAKLALYSGFLTITGLRKLAVHHIIIRHLLLFRGLGGFMQHRDAFTLIKDVPARFKNVGVAKDK